MVKKLTSTKVIETRFPDLPEEVSTYMPPKISKSNEVKLIKTSKSSSSDNITILPTKSKSSNETESVSSSQNSVPPVVQLSPMRTRLLERTVEKTPIEKEKKTEKKTESKKPRKKVVIDVKSPPKVFKSPTWYKSPSKKVVKEEDLVFKQLLLKDPKLTERDISKILADHKS
jgi:hypothetical protein